MTLSPGKALAQVAEIGSARRAKARERAATPGARRLVRLADMASRRPWIRYLLPLFVLAAAAMKAAGLGHAVLIVIRCWRCPSQSS